MVINGISHTRFFLPHSKNDCDDAISPIVFSTVTRQKYLIPPAKEYGRENPDGIKAVLVKEYITSHPEAGICEASNAVCEGFLKEYGEVNFVNTICNKFKSVQYFTCSALGHNATGEKFAPENVETPLLWIIDKMSQEINLYSVWGKKI